MKKIISVIALCAIQLIQAQSIGDRAYQLVQLSDENQALEELKQIEITNSDVESASGIYEILVKGKYKLAEYLFLTKKYPITENNVSGMYAYPSSDPRSASYMYAKGICIAPRRSNAVDLAESKARVSLLEKLVANGLKINTLMLMSQSITVNDLASFKMLQKNYSKPLTQLEYHEFAANAAAGGVIEFVEYFKTQGYKYINEPQRSILENAAHHPEMFNLFLELGADLNPKIQTNSTPLIFFALNNGACPEILEKLLKTGYFTKDLKTRQGMNVFDYNKKFNDLNAKEAQKILNTYLK